MCCWKHFHQLSTWGLHNWEERVWGHAVFKYECNFFQNQVPWSSKSVCYLFFELSRVLINETWYCSQLYGIFCKKNSLTLKTSDQSLSHMWAIPLHLKSFVGIKTCPRPSRCPLQGRTWRTSRQLEEPHQEPFCAPPRWTRPPRRAQVRTSCPSPRRAPGMNNIKPSYLVHITSFDTW